MRCQPLGNAARGRNYINIFVAIVFAGEGDHGAVGRKNRVDFNADIARETPGLATAAIHNPQVAAVAERNLRLADCGLAQKRVLVGGLRAELPHCEE